MAVLPSTDVTTQNSSSDSPVVVQLASSGNNSIIDRTSDPILDPVGSGMAAPTIMSKTITSNAAESSTQQTCYFGNEDRYNASPTNNGSGADSIVNTYGDGWAGNGYNAAMYSLMNGRGVMCYGMTLSFITTSGGGQNPSGITTSSLTYQTVNLVGANFLSVGVPLNAGLRNTQFLSGTMTVLKRFFMSSLNQISFIVPAGNTVNIIVFSQPQ